MVSSVCDVRVQIVAYRTAAVAVADIAGDAERAAEQRSGSAAVGIAGCGADGAAAARQGDDPRAIKPARAVVCSVGDEEVAAEVCADARRVAKERVGCIGVVREPGDRVVAAAGVGRDDVGADANVPKYVVAAVGDDNVAAVPDGQPIRRVEGGKSADAVGAARNRAA